MYLKQRRNCIDISVDKYFWAHFYQKSICHISSLPAYLLSSGLWEPRTGCVTISLVVSPPHLSQMHISCIATKYLQMCVFCPLDTLA